jgi:hypothetical protein
MIISHMSAKIPTNSWQEEGFPFPPQNLQGSVTKAFPAESRLHPRSGVHPPQETGFRIVTQASDVGTLYYWYQCQDKTF